MDLIQLAVLFPRTFISKIVRDRQQATSLSDCTVTKKCNVLESKIFTGNRYPGLMKPGMTFTIEPALSHGSEKVVILEDGWTVITDDGSRAAQAEHTILITEHGAEILT